MLWGLLDIIGLNEGLSNVFVNDFLDDVRRIKRERILYQFERMGDVPKLKEPTFVFAHMLIPHGVFVFDKDGNAISRIEEGRKSHKKLYLGQVQFVNKKDNGTYRNNLKQIGN